MLDNFIRYFISLLALVFFPINAYSISYMSALKPAQVTKRLSAQLESMTIEISDLARFNLRAACFGAKHKSKLALIDNHYLKMPVRVKSAAERHSKRSLKSLRSALKSARARCAKLRTQSDRDNSNDNSTSKPNVPIPSLAQWQANMKTMGAKHCKNLANGSLGDEGSLAATYYDAEWIFYQIGDYTHDSSWYDCAQHAEKYYRDKYVIANAGVVPGYWNFTHGLVYDYLSTGDKSSQEAAVLLSRSASFAAESTPLSTTSDANMSREVAYAIMSYLNAESVGQPHRARTEQLVTQALDHINQWTISHSAEYVRPFMFALTAQALISYDSRGRGNPNILPTIERGADWLWNNCWIPSLGAFKYTDRNVASGGTEAAPDLNLLIAPVYAWLWHKTGDVAFRDRADQIFSGGINGAYLNNPKQFNQNYRWSFDYVKWRSVPPLR